MIDLLSDPGKQARNYPGYTKAAQDLAADRGIAARPSATRTPFEQLLRARFASEGYTAEKDLGELVECRTSKPGTTRARIPTSWLAQAKP